MLNQTWSCRLAAVFAAAVGVFLLLGSWGHLEATLPLVEGVSLGSTLLLLPGLLLLVPGLLNLLASRGLWRAEPSAYSFATWLNGVLLAYLAFLLLRGVPGHPMLFFLLLVGACFLFLAAVRHKVGRAAESPVP